jgi:hypothetical protein
VLLFSVKDGRLGSVGLQSDLVELAESDIGSPRPAMYELVLFDPLQLSVVESVLTRRTDVVGDSATLCGLCAGLDGLLYNLGTTWSLDSISWSSPDDNLRRLCNDGDWTHSGDVMSAPGTAVGEYEIAESILYSPSARPVLN